MSKLVLPKTDEEGVPYLSYSQLSKWKKSKRDYIRQYFFKEKDDNKMLQKYGDFGTKVGEALENNDYSKFTDKEKELMTTIPRYDEFEREIKLQMDGFYIKGFIDTNTSDGKKLADYKTGEIDKRRGDYESEDYIQTEIYSAAIKQDFGKLPEEVHVFLIHRNGNAFKGEKLTLGKEFITITRDVTQNKVDKVLKGVQETAEEISAYYQLFLKLNK